MTAAERQSRFRAKGKAARRVSSTLMTEDPKGFALRFRRQFGYMPTLALRDALDWAMDQGDAPPSGYLLR